MSSLRAIEPMALPGVEPGPIAGDMPRLEWGDPTTLWVDETYQRNISERLVKLIRKIVAEFAWRRFSPPKVVPVDGRRHVLDGQHTAIAAASHPGGRPRAVAPAGSAGRRPSASRSSNIRTRE